MPKATVNARVLIVEDESIVAMDLQQQLADLGYDVVGLAASVDEALEVARGKPVDIALMDIRLKGERDGVDAARELMARWRLPVIFLTSHSDERNVSRAAEIGAYGYLTKPFQLKEVRAAIEVALAKARLERQLREADQWFASTLRCLTDGLVVTDPEARIKLLNPSAERMTGWSSEEAAGRFVGEIVSLAGKAHAASTPAALELAKRAVQQERPVPVVHDMTLRDRSQREITIDASAGPVLGDDNQVLGSLLVLRDARERLEKEAQLRDSEERFRSAFDHAPLGMSLVSQTGHLIQSNVTLTRWLGGDAAGCKLSELQPEDEWPLTEQRLRELLSSKQRVVQFETRLRPWPAGTPDLHVLISASVQERAGCFLLQIHDLTEQRAAAARLAELAHERMQREASEAAIDAHQRLLNRVSHELRTPLNAVIGFAQLLEMQPGGTPEIQRWVRHIREAGNHLLVLVTDLMDMNRAQRGELSLSLEPVSMMSAMQSACDLVSAQAREAGVELRVDGSAALAGMADPTRLRQVLLNLVTNAVKYNRSGGSVEVAAVADGDEWLTVTVRDTGQGMAAKQLEQLFQPFNRLGAERSTVPGVGLGMVIARSLVQAMDGDVSVASVPGQGTTVTVRLRRAPAPTA